MNARPPFWLSSTRQRLTRERSQPPCRPQRIPLPNQRAQPARPSHPPPPAAQNIVQYELMDRVRERMRGGGVVPSASGQTDNSARNRGCLLRPTLTRPAGPPLHNASLPLSALRLHRATTKSSQTGLRPYGPATPWTASTSGRTTMRSGSGGCSAGCDACFSSTTSTAPLLAGRC